MKRNKETLIHLYIGGLVISIVLITISILIFYFGKKDLMIINIFISIGCGSISACILSFFIERINKKKIYEKRISLRDEILFGFPVGLLWIPKTICEFFYKNKTNNKSFLECFHDSCQKAINIKDENGMINKKLLDTLKYGFDLIGRDAKRIIDSREYLLVEEIFTIDELLEIQSVLVDIERIKLSYILAETIEYIKVMIDFSKNVLKEIDYCLNKKIELENNYVLNWHHLSKIKN